MSDERLQTDNTSLSRALQLKTELRLRAGKAGEDLYIRIGIAAELLADQVWIAAECGGDEYRARDLVEDEFFGDRAVALSVLLLMHQRVPEEEWRFYRYNFAHVYTAYLDLLDKERPPAQTLPKASHKAEPRPTKAQVQHLEQELLHTRTAADSAEKELATVRREVSSVEKELSRANAEIRRLSALVNQKDIEIARLNGRIEELQRRTLEPSAA